MAAPENSADLDDTTEGPDETRAQTRRFHLKLSSLFLDPNNYRFIDHKDYKRIERDEDSFSSNVQSTTRRLILGMNQSNVDDLLASLKQNGWLDMEPIQVRQVGTRYLVVEGNRRVATLKYLQEQYQNNGIVGALDPATFDKVPVVRVAEVDPLHHLVVMGLHHISGKRQWPPINQAQLMYKLRTEYKKSPDEICKALAISKREFNLSIRTLKLVELYKQSDYGEQFTSDKFNLFKEVLKAPSLRDFIGWDEIREQANNTGRLMRLFSWFSREVSTEELDSDDDVRSHNQLSVEPVVTTGTNVRELAKIINDPATVKVLDETRSLQEASVSSGIIARNEVDTALQRIDQGKRVLFARATSLERDDIARIEEYLNQLQGVIVAAGQRKVAANLSQASWTPYQEFRKHQFSDIKVAQYRKLRDVHLPQPGRINLLAGINNAGKTSLLEAIFLLARQCDSRALLETLRRRAHQEKLPDTQVLVSLMPEEGKLDGKFDERSTTVSWHISSEPEDEDIDRATFEREIRMEARYVDPVAGEKLQSSTTTLRTDRNPQIRLQGEARILCPAEFTSPFSLAEPASLVAANEASSKAGVKGEIIKLLRDSFAGKLESIELVNASARFHVQLEERSRGEDLGIYGEGMQRVFHIAMLFASVQGGVLLIDEFENAVHARAFVPFASLIRSLAERFHVQVFLSTHSAEVVHAWTMTEELRKDVVGYGLRRTESNALEALRFDGEKLHALNEAFGFDLRGLS